MCREMKDSGIEWIGEIPQHWNVKKHKYVMFKKKDICSKYEGEDILSLTMKGVIVRDLESPTGKMPASFDGYQRIYKDNLLLCLFDIDVTPRCVGVIKNDGLTSPAYSQFIMKDNNNSEYYNYLLTTIDDKKCFIHLSKNLRSSLTEDDFGVLKTIVPPVKEQEGIANYLDKKVCQIDDIILKQKNLIAKYKMYKQSLITETVTKGLNNNIVMKNSGIEWAPNIPQKWEIKKYKHVMYKKKDVCSKYEGESILSLTMKGVIVRDLENPMGKMPASFDGYQRIYKNNLLLCLFDIDVTPRCIGLIENDGLTSPAYSQFVMKDNNSAKYYTYLLTMMDDKKYFVHLSKNLRSSLTEEDFGVIKTIMPPIDEQKQIADFLDKKCDAIHSIISKKEQLIEKLEEYKKSLIYECVTGKREVN